MYAILDIETTGGKFNEEGITEIAIYKFDGHTVVDQFISLVNPEREIQPFVVNLTGINSNMLRTAPKFYEVAKRIVEITEDCIIVAHNAEFDYRILRTEFSRLGFEFKRRTLCTVELAQEIMPEQESYSLGKLTRALGIPVADRHRASGDALATVKLFKMLLAKDLNKHIIQDAVKAEPKYQMATNLKSIINGLPSSTGVFYFHDTYGKIIYIGKSKNIRNRVNQHFTSTNPKSKKMQKQVAAVTYEATGNELVALLKESAEIKLNKPSFNRAMRRSTFTHALYSFIDENGYINLKIDSIDGRKTAITTFSNYQSGKQFMFKAIENYKLCPKLVGLDTAKTSCFKYHINECKGACIKEESPTDYNLRIQELIAKNSYKNKDLLIIDKGRALEERSVLLIEDGTFKGLGYYDLNFQITNKKVLESIITPMEDNKDTQHIIQSYLRKNKQIKIVELNK
ncbi:exonuclease domain-containing protein [Gelidibacter gilvus]|uniref:Exonuclease n=1 Tax=Gelidibacter gilvus TaxID=59602 RepID=A0A4Q0XIB2_9FLAO|nr:exonuclease domain-containing protein [Gelidibacter gilvus]RXJ50761.1 exonuclease [Gelidibacter gilvus]